MSTKQRLALPLGVLQRALAAVAPAVQRKTTIPVLGTVRVEQTESTLDFAATNLDLAIRRRVKLAGNPTEAILLPAIKLTEYAKLLVGQDVSLESDDTRATLRCGRSHTKLPLINAANFPQITLGDGVKGTRISQALAERLIQFVESSISREASRYTLNAALLEVDNGQLTLVATDGHRLTRYSAPTDQETGQEKATMLIPAGLLDALKKTLNASSKMPLVLLLTDEAVLANVADADGDTEFSHRRTTGQFPNYRPVIPSEMVASVLVDADAARASIKRCLSFADERTGAVKLEIGPDEIKLSGESSENGVTDETLEVRSPHTFPAFRIGFNGHYLLEAFAGLKGDVELRFAECGSQRPLLLVASPEEGETLEVVIMPMRV